MRNRLSGTIGPHEVELVVKILQPYKEVDNLWPILEKYYEEFNRLPTIGEALRYSPKHTFFMRQLIYTGQQTIMVYEKQ